MANLLRTNNLRKIEGKKVDVVIPEKVQQQIKYLCKEIPNVEWSGVLFYKIIQGDIDDISTCVLELQEIMPKDMGTSGSTEYEYGIDVMNFMEEHKAMDNDWIIAHIHSHCNMQVYFSGVDERELVDNAPNHDFYLSIIVNNKNEIIGRLVLNSKSDVAKNIEVPYYANSYNKGRFKVFSRALEYEKEFNFYYECNIITGKENEITDSFKDFVNKIKEEGRTRVSEFNTNSYHRFESEDDDISYPTSSYNYNRGNSITTSNDADTRMELNYINIYNSLPKLMLFGYEVDYKEFKEELSTLASTIELMEERDFDVYHTAKYISKNLDTFFETFFKGYSKYKDTSYWLLLRALNDYIDDPKVIDDIKDYCKVIAEGVEKYFSNILPVSFKSYSDMRSKTNKLLN